MFVVRAFSVRMKIEMDGKRMKKMGAIRCSFYVVIVVAVVVNIYVGYYFFLQICFSYSIWGA